jgi:hypothetical protein
MTSLATDNKAKPPSKDTPHARPAWEPLPYPPWGTAGSKGNGQYTYEKDKKIVEFCKENGRLPRYKHLSERNLYKQWNGRQQNYEEAYQKTGDQQLIDAFKRLERWIAGACGKEDISELFADARTKNRRDKLVKYVPKELTAEMANMSLDTKPPAEVEDKALQKYYTTAARIAKCIVTIREKLNINEDDVIIEPSAGDGRWVPYLKTLCKNVEAYDIKPDVPEVKKMDFLDYVAPTDKKIHVIGNPPFHGVEEKFIKKCVEFADTISFILPAKYMRRDNLNLYYNADGTEHKTIYHLPLEFHPIYTEYMEKEKFNGTPNLQPVAFIIWEKRSDPRPTISMPKGEFYEYIEYSKRSSANAKIQLKDGYCWSYDKTQERAYNDNMDRHYYLKINTSLISVKAFAEEYNKLDLKKMYPERSYCRNELHYRISKFDLFTALKEFWDEQAPIDWAAVEKVLGIVKEEADKNQEFGRMIITNEEECRLLKKLDTYRLDEHFPYYQLEFKGLSDKCYKMLSPIFPNLVISHELIIDGITDEGIKHLAETLQVATEILHISSEELSENGWREFIDTLKFKDYCIFSGLRLTGSGVTDNICSCLADVYKVNKFDLGDFEELFITSKNIGAEGKKILADLQCAWGGKVYLNDKPAEPNKMSAEPTKVPAEVPVAPAPEKVTAEDIEEFKQGGYTKEGYRKWEDGKEPPDGRKWVDEYFATTNSKDLFGECGYKTPPVLTKERPNLYRRTYLKK